MRRPDGYRGYTLAEVIILVTIITLLTAIAGFSYFHFRVKAHTMEAKMGLNGIWKREIDYHHDRGTYSPNLNEIGFTMDGAARYTYEVMSADATDFTARALANLDGDPALDVWYINSRGTLWNAESD